MKTKAITPEKARIEAKKLSDTDRGNVDLIISGINDYITTELATNDLAKMVTIHHRTIRWPNKNWREQNVQAIEKALKAFEKDWKVKRTGKWSDSFCHVTFTPKKQN